MLFTASWTKSVPRESIITFIPLQEVPNSCGSITLVSLNFCVLSHLLMPAEDRWWIVTMIFQLTSCAVGLLKLPDAQLHPAIKFWWFFCSGYWHSLAGLLALWSLSTRPPILKIILQSGPSVFRLKLKRTVIFLLGIIPSWIPLQTERAVRFSLFAKVSITFSDKLPKVACSQKFLLTQLDFCGNLFQQFNITYFT